MYSLYLGCKSTPPAVSIILPTYNRAGKLFRSIGSVLRQTFSDFELIIVDDNSTDDTKDIVKTIVDKRIKYLTTSNQLGAGGARNLGISVAGGDFIAFQDSDDEWIETKLQEQMDILLSRPEIGVVFSPFLRVSLEGSQLIPAKVTENMHGNIFNSILASSFIGTPTMIVRRSCLSSSGYFDENLQTLEDWELSIRLAKQCRFACINKALVNAYVTAGSVSENEEIQLQTREIILAKHRDDYNAHPKSEANIWTFIANRRCLAGYLKKGRLNFLNAIKCNPLNLSAWFGLILAFSGKTIYRYLITLKRRLAQPMS